MCLGLTEWLTAVVPMKETLETSPRQQATGGDDPILHRVVDGVWRPNIYTSVLCTGVINWSLLSYSASDIPYDPMYTQVAEYGSVDHSNSHTLGQIGEALKLPLLPCVITCNGQNGQRSTIRDVEEKFVSNNIHIIRLGDSSSQCCSY